MMRGVRRGKMPAYSEKPAPVGEVTVTVAVATVVVALVEFPALAAVVLRETTCW